MAGVWYATREQVKASVDIKNSLRANEQISRAIADASRSVERMCRRVFHPRYVTRNWCSPTADSPTPGVLWLGGESEMIELIDFASGGQSADLADITLEPTTGPPYTRLEFTGARSSEGTYRAKLGYSDDQTPAGTISTPSGISSMDTQLDVSDGSVVGAGHLLACDTERMVVTAKTTQNTGLTLATDLAEKMNAVTVELSGTAQAPNPGEMILIGGERMLVQDRTGTTAYVTRQVDGTVLMAHTTGAAVYAYRTLTVERAAVGTTAIIHPQGSELTAYVPPPSINGLVVAEALNQIAQEHSAYARVIGSGENQREARGAGLVDKRKRVRTEFGRRVRMGAV